MRLLPRRPAPVTHAVRWEPCQVTDGRTVTVTWWCSCGVAGSGTPDEALDQGIEHRRRGE